MEKQGITRGMKEIDAALQKISEAKSALLAARRFYPTEMWDKFECHTVGAANYLELATYDLECDRNLLAAMKEMKA